MTNFSFYSGSTESEARNNMKVTFEGIPSGDHECFCWAVDAETFERVTGRKPHEDADANRFHPNMFSLYPSEALRLFDKHSKLKFVLESEE